MKWEWAGLGALVSIPIGIVAFALVTNLGTGNKPTTPAASASAPSSAPSASPTPSAQGNESGQEDARAPTPTPPELPGSEKALLSARNAYSTELNMAPDDQRRLWLEPQKRIAWIQAVIRAEGFSDWVAVVDAIDSYDTYERVHFALSDSLEFWADFPTTSKLERGQTVYISGRIADVTIVTGSDDSPTCFDVNGCKVSLYRVGSSPQKMSKSASIQETKVAGRSSEPPQLPAWTKVDDGAPPAYVPMYVDQTSVTRNGNVATAWFVQDMKNELPIGTTDKKFASVEFDAEFDCSSDLYRSNYYGLFSDHMGRGALVQGGQLPASDPMYSSAPTPDGMKEAQKVACASYSPAP